MNSLAQGEQVKVGKGLIMEVLAAQERLLAERILAPIGDQGEPFPELCGFLAAKGCMYRGDLMVVGRALNGWFTCARSERFANPAFRREFVQQIHPNGECPTEWAQRQWGPGYPYNTRRSAFWRVVRRITEGLNVTDPGSGDWPCQLVWSNIYKVSPAVGRNPNKRLRKVQFHGCKDLFQIELKTYCPKRLVLLTGWRGWAEPVLGQLG